MDKKKMYIGAGAAVGALAIAAVFFMGGEETTVGGGTSVPSPRVANNLPTDVKETPKAVERGAAKSNQSGGAGRLTSNQAQEAPEEELEPEKKKKKKKARKGRRTPRKKRAKEDAEMPDIDIPEPEKREKAKRF